MKKAGLYLLAALSLSLYCMAMSPRFMRFFVRDLSNEKRPGLLHWDKYKYGDLYGVSYLSDYKQEVEGTFKALQKTPAGDAEVHLWIIGDSFLEKGFRTDSGEFNTGNVHVHHFFWYRTDEQPEIYHPVQGKKNILLIEMNERFISEYLLKNNADKYLRCYLAEDEKMPATSSKTKVTTRIVPEKIEQNIETLLFGYELFAPFKEAKAKFNFSVLGRENDIVFVSKAQQRLYLSGTITPKKACSSFITISDKQIDVFVASINRVCDAYKAKGFDEVLVSFVPNAATLTPPDAYVYNKLIPRIQQHPEFKVPFIDVYSPMMASQHPETLYWKSDTHWNANGFSMWLQLFKEQMNNLPDKAPANQ